MKDSFEGCTTELLPQRSQAFCSGLSAGEVALDPEPRPLLPRVIHHTWPEVPGLRAVWVQVWGQ